MHYSDFQDWNQNVKVVRIYCHIVEVVEVCWNWNVEAVEICCNLEDCESWNRNVEAVEICCNLEDCESSRALLKQKVKLKL